MIAPSQSTKVTAKYAKQQTKNNNDFVRSVLEIKKEAEHVVYNNKTIPTRSGAEMNIRKQIQSRLLTWGKGMKDCHLKYIYHNPA